MTDAETANVQLVKRTYAAFGRGDIEAVVEAMHPEIAWHEAEHSPWHAPDGHHGPNDVVANVFARIPDDFEAFEVVAERFHDAGDVVIVEARYRGRARATAEELDAQVCHVWTIRDGALAAFRQYTDTLHFARLTGARTG